MTIKDGYKTSEFWIAIISGICFAIFPDFPKESFMAVAFWIVARSGQKFFGLVDPKTDKASWQTSEFWITIVFSIINTVFPDIPQEALYSVMVWTFARVGIKITTKVKSEKVSKP